MSTTPYKLGSNAKPEEIIGHVRHLYPDLGPALRQLLEMYDDNSLWDEIRRLANENDTLERRLDELEKDEGFDKNCKCPHCGSVVELSE